MYDTILIMGRSGVGKNLLQNMVCNIDQEKNFHKVITSTTRSPREKEKNGKDYFFLSEEEFKNKSMIEKTCFNNWWYGTSLDNFQKDKINLLIVNPKGLEIYLKSSQVRILEVYLLEASTNERIRRQTAREKNPNIGEIQRRLQADEEDFNALQGDFITLPNNSIDDLAVGVCQVLAWANVNYEQEVIHKYIVSNFTQNTISNKERELYDYCC